MLLVSKRPQPAIAGSVKWAMSSRNVGLPSSCHHEASGDSADRWVSVARERLTLFGRDELLLAGLDAGAAGAIGSTYNYMAPIYRRLVAAWAAGDRLQAKQLQARATAIIDVMIRHGGLPAGTQIMGLSGIDCGPVRSPLANLAVTAARQLRDELIAAGRPIGQDGVP
jgi:dihydrodipicolinate synthase/N-acetylneuraminate lyase